MAGAMRKMAVYLGLVEDEDERYDDLADVDGMDEPTPVRRYSAAVDEPAPEPAFARLAQIAANVRATHPAATTLSAGMSGDLEAAVAAGATHVRIGTALLGGRATPVR